MSRNRMFTDILVDPANLTEVEDDIDFTGTKKNLLETFNKTDVLHMAEHMKVYLRIRPFLQSDLEKNEDQKCFNIENENTLMTSAPKDSHTFKNFAHGLGKTSHKFKFSKIFPQETTQKELFDASMLGLVQNFIDGQNCLVFTYGITSSGKTYTIQGKPRDAGILPRTLDVLFNSIVNKQCTSINHKPNMFMDVRKLTPSQVQEENKIKEQVLKMCSTQDQDIETLLGEDASDMSVINSTCSESSNMCVPIESQHKESVDSNSDLFTELENRVREETAVSVADQGQIRFSIWVSFAEIYNEQIFDLLEAIPRKKNARRPILGLRDDKNGSPYIKGLKEVCVSSADEAYKLLTVGQKNLRMACTKLNHNSSRSHCIFNIKIIRVIDCENPHVARVSMLSLCDLAGSERNSKTLATGNRLKEAGNINTSLMTLGRCIDILRHNQLHKEHVKIVPFRESKLTRLFQNFFCGRGKAAMIVNVNQCASMFDESLNVFKFSAIAKQVVVVQKPEPKPKVLPKTSREAPAVRPSIPWEAPTPRTLKKLDSELLMVQNVMLPDDDDSDLEETDQEINDLVCTIRELEKRLNDEMISKNQLEAKIRQEVCDEMMKQIVEIEDECSERIREKECEKEEMRVKLLLSSVNRRKRRRCDDDGDDDEMVSSIRLHSEQVKVEECNKKNEVLTQQNEELVTQVARLTRDVEKLTQDKTAVQFQLAEVKRTTHKALDESVFNDTIRDQEKQIKDLTEMLQEAAETFQENQEEITKLKAALQEDEEKLEQQACVLRELRTGLTSSNEALEDSKMRLQSKNDRLASLEAQVLLKQVSQMEEYTKGRQPLHTNGCPFVSVADENDDLRKQLEHVEHAGASRKSIELDCFIEKKEKRIGDLDKIIAQKDLELERVKLRLKKEEEDSTQRDQALIHGYTAEINSHKAQIVALKSSVVGLEKKLKKEESVREDLNQQIRELKKILDQSGLTSAEHDHSKQISKSAVEDLERCLQAECARHKQTESKMGEVSRIGCEKQRELDAALQKVEDLKAEVKELTDVITSKEDTSVDGDFILEELKIKLESVEEESRLVKQEHANLMTQVVDKQNEIDTAEENFQKASAVLKSELSERTAMSERNERRVEELEKKVEELEVVNKELREMISQTTDVLSRKEVDMKELITKKEAEMKKEICCKESEYRKLFKESEELQGRLKQQSEKLSQTESEMHELKSSLTARQMECETLSMNVLVLKEKLSSEEKDVHDKFTCQLKEVEEKFSNTIKNLQDKMNSQEQEYNQKITSKEKELKDVLNKLMSTEEKFKEEITSKDKELKDVLNKLTSTEEKFKEEITSKEKELKDLLNKLTSTEEKFKEEITSKEKELKDVLNKLTSMEKDVDEKMNCKENQLNDAQLKLTSREEELHSAFNLQQNQLGNILTEKEQDLEVKLAAYDRVVEELTLMKKEMGDMEKKWLTASKELTQLQEMFGQEKFERVALKSELDNKMVECTAMKNELTQSNSVIEELKMSKESLVVDAKELKKLQELLNEEKFERVSVKSELDEKLEECAALKREVTGLNSLIDDLKKTNGSLFDSKELSQLKELLTKEKSERVALQSEMDNKSEECAALKTELSKLNCELEELETVKKSLDDQLFEAKSEVEEKLSLNVELKRKYIDLKIEVETVFDRVEKLGEELERKELEFAETTDRLQDEVLAKDRELETLRQLERKERELTETIDRLQDEVRAKDQELETFRQLKRKERELTETIDRLQDDVSAKDQELETFRQTVNALRNELSTEDSNTQKLNSAVVEVAQLKSALHMEQTLHTNYKQQKMELEEKLALLSNIQQEKTELEEKLAFLSNIQQEKNELEEKLTLLSNIQQEKTELEEKLALLSNIQQEKTELEEKLTLLSNIQQEKNELEEKLTLLSNLKQENTDLQERLSLLSNLKEEKMELEEKPVVMVPGSSRRLRKEKIDMEMQLVNAKHELELLRAKLDHLKSSESSAVSESPRLIGSPAHTEEQLQGREKDLGEVFTPTTPSMSSGSFFNEELQKSRDREGRLRQQLKQARCTLMENVEKICRLEENLNKKELEILDLDDKLKTLRARKESISHGQEDELRELKGDLKRKGEKLEQKNAKVKELKHTMELERERFEKSLKETKDNESLLETLKNVIHEQEETMATQDVVLNSRDEEIQRINEKLEQSKKREEMLSRESEDLQRRIQKQSVQYSSLKRQEEDRASERGQLETRMKTEQLEKGAVHRKREESLSAECGRLQAVVDTLTTDKDRLNIVHDKKEETLSAECNRLQHIVNSLTTDKDKLNVTHGKREETLAAECSRLQAVVDRMTAEKDRLNVLHGRKEETLGVECSRLQGVVSSLMSDKDRLNAVLKENNLNIASLEKLLAEKSDTVEKQNGSDENLKTELNTLKERLKEKSFEVLKLEKQKTNLERELKLIRGDLSEKDEKMQTWRQNRDELVGKLETLLKGQACEIKELKKTLLKLQNINQEKAELQNHVDVRLKANEEMIGDLKMSNSQLQDQIAKSQGFPPTPVFVNDEVDTRGHRNIDATPPSAAKALKKSARKRGHQTETKTELQEESTERRPKRKAASAAKDRILTMVTNSPMTRSASSNADIPKKGKKRSLYKEKISAPFDCAPFMPSLPETPEKVDVHDVVQRQLRNRGRGKSQNTFV